MLLENGPDPNPTISNHEYPLFLASRGYQLDAVELRFNYGADAKRLETGVARIIPANDNHLWAD